MGIIVGKSNREQWSIKNVSSGSISIGDLPKCPVVGPNKIVDLLRYHTKEEINQSIYLKRLIDRRTVKAMKTSDSVELDSYDVKVYESVEGNEIEDFAPSGEAVVEAKVLISDNYSVQSTDKNIYVTATAENNITVTLPASTGSGRVLTIKKIDDTIGTVIIEGNGSDTLDGELNQTLIIEHESITIQDVSTGNWYIN